MTFLPTSTLPAPFYVSVSSPADVISLRQQVRATARLLGIPLAQQAKITTATGGLATELYAHYPNIMWMVRVVHEHGQPMLDVSCVVRHLPAHAESNWDAMLGLDTIRLLVDQVKVTTQLGRLQVVVRVHATSAPASPALSLPRVWERAA